MYILKILLLIFVQNIRRGKGFEYFLCFNSVLLAVVYFSLKLLLWVLETQG